MRLLLVEDDEKIASFIIKGFKAEGFAVDHAADGQNGLHLALTEPYDAAIVDIMLPELDGLAFLAKAREIQPEASRILLTGYADKESAIRSINEIGLYQYIENPGTTSSC